MQAGDRRPAEVDFGRHAARLGLQATTSGGTVLDLAADLVTIARNGLGRQQESQDDDESAFLDPLKIVFDNGECPARTLMKHWNTDFARNPVKLVEHLAKVNLRCYER